MRLRSFGLVAVAFAALAPAPEPLSPPPPEIVSIVVHGQGNGHGRGLSAWGAFGLSVNHGWSWTQILDHYYGGTVAGTAGNDGVRIRLMALDNASRTNVISAAWGGQPFAAIEAESIGGNRYNVWAAPTPRCGGGDDWVLLAAGAAGPLQFTASGEPIGVCQPNESVIHYRGSVIVLNDSAGATHTVNELSMEDYVRGVVPREAPASWGNSAGGAGMHSLYAMAVAARSFGHSQSRYPYADTCDTAACQVYGGWASRPTPTGARTVREHPNTNAAVARTWGVVRRWPDGRMVSTEYSATHGPRSAGGQFPPVDDWFSNVPKNPLYTWVRTLDAAALETAYGLGDLVGAYSERDPASPFDGIWGNQVVLQGTAGTVVVPALTFRNSWGFPSHGLVVAGVNWSS